MDSATHAVMNFVSECLDAGEPCWLITVVTTWGSAPRLPGASLAWNASRGSCGSLSGGCIEEDLLNKLADNHFAGREQPFFEIYGVSAEDAAHWGLPCGGRLELLLEYLPATASRQQHFRQLCSALQNREGLSRKIDLNRSFTDAGCVTLEPARPHPLVHSKAGVSYYLGPRYRLVIIGANQVAQYLAEFSKTLDFDVWICDPREQAFDHWPLAFTENIRQLPDDLIREKACDPHTAIVAVAHDPRIDDMALMEALTRECFYVGAMGSKRSTEARLGRLRELGLSPAQLDRLIAPVGLDIGSKTPQEIAMAIAADLIRAIRRG
ncbi:MAG: XdhC family protein [Ketobacteraceae bacterium]|nr:XdhC family protein [Ketobacteraceae bacterium]